MLAALSACSIGQPDPVAQAQADFTAQDYFAAHGHVLEALQDDAADPAALELLVRVQLAMGQGADAIVTLERLAKADGLPADAALIKAEALLQTGEHAEALDLLVGDSSAESWRLRALASAMTGDEAGANAAFLAGRDAPGDKRKLFTAEASHHLTRGDADAARYAVGQAQRLAPNRVETLFVSARLAELEDEPQLAARAFMAILDRAPNDRPALLGAIGALDAIGRMDLVRDLIRRGRAAYPQDFEFLYLAASLHAHDGQWEVVRSTLQEQEGAIANHDDARSLYGQALLELGQLEQARAQLAPLHRRQPGNAVYARIFARILIESGDKAEARRVIGPFASRPNAAPIDRELAEQAARG